jgi:hypothetical protein
LIAWPDGGCATTGVPIEKRQINPWRWQEQFGFSAEPPASTALDVSALALPGMMIEVDAIAVQ